MTAFTRFAATALLLAPLAALPGCETLAAKVPTTASQVAVGSGTTAYRAANSGKVYVYDRTWNMLRYSGDVRLGQVVAVDARNDRILIDNMPVVEQVSLDDNARYEIYLDQPPVTVRRTTVIEREIRD